MVVDKRQAIKFLIEECYKKFPELMREISEDEMSKILEKNISIIIAGGKSTDFGLYNPSKREIRLFCKGEVSLDDIKNSEELIRTLAHEGIHALFRKSKYVTRS